MQTNNLDPDDGAVSLHGEDWHIAARNSEDAALWTPHGPLEDEVEKEAEALGRIIHALLDYRIDAEWEINRWQDNFSRLSERHQHFLANQSAKFAAVHDCVTANDRFFRSMIRCLAEEASEEGWPLHRALGVAQQRLEQGSRVSPADAEKCRYVLKNLVRDWGSEGAAERAQSYGRIVEELRSRYQDRLAAEGTPPRVLVPGAGLGRLCLDIAKVGFHTQGNEFSYFMLLTSSFMLNLCERAEQWTIFPWALASCNQPDSAAQLRPASIPDELPADAAAAAAGGLALSMAAGDFVEVYGSPEQEGQFDCVATCFFIDTAHNVIRYMEVLRHCLKDGGLWINLGPLQYHWADAHTYMELDMADSVEVPLEDVERIAGELGFRTLRHEMVDAGFNTSSRSMQVSSYRCASWTMELEKG